MSNLDQPVKEKNISNVVMGLTATFTRATQHLERAHRNNKTGIANRTYKLQSEFAYLIHEIMMSPPCIQQRYITECNELIEQVLLEKRAAKAAS